MPRGKKPGMYPLVGCIQWRLRYWSDRANVSSTLEKARIRHAEASAEKMELDNAERRAELVSANRVGRALGESLQVIRDSLRALPSRAARLDDDGKNWLAAEIDEALKAAQRTLEAHDFAAISPDEAPDGSPDETGQGEPLPPGAPPQGEETLVPPSTATAPRNRPAEEPPGGAAP